MSICEHEFSNRVTKNETILGETFIFECDECSSCGFYSWDEATYSEFNRWLDTLRKKNPDKFSFQKFRLPESLWNYIYSDLSHEIGEVNFSALIKAATWIYIRRVVPSAEFSRALEEYYVNQDKKFIQNKRVGNKKIRFNPKLFLEIHRWSKKMKMTEKEFAENAAARVLYAAKWHDEIKRYLKERLEAA